MAFLEQQQSRMPQLFEVDRLSTGERMTVRQGYFEGVTEQGSHLDIPAVVWESEQHDVEPSGMQLFDQPCGQVLDEIKPKSGICAPQPGQNIRQQKWADGRDHTHTEGSAEGLALGAGGFHEVFAVAKYSSCALDNLSP
jgi:hypothetical protein